MRFNVACLLSLFCFDAYANAIQYFIGLNYNNPAELFKVKDNEFILGGNVLNPMMKFNGISINANTFGYEQGVAKTNTLGFLPYGRLAHRVNERLVLGVDVTEPYYSNINWGNDSVLRYVSTQTRITDYDISPRASWSVNKSLYLGAGLNFNLLRDSQVNFAVPVNTLEYGNLINQSRASGVGYDLGAYYAVNPTNFVGLSYFSAFNLNLTGTSYIQGTSLTNSNHSSPAPLPATFGLSYTHLLSKTWLASFQVFYSDWSSFESLLLKSTVVGDFNFIANYHGSAVLIGVLRNQYSEKLGVTLIAATDRNPVPDPLRAPGLPSDDQFVLALSGDYQASKNVNLQLTYGRGTSRPLIRMNLGLPGGQEVPLTYGNIKINANLLDFRIKVAV